MNSNLNGGFSLQSRFIFRTGEYVLDIGRSVFKNNTRVGYSIHSFFLNEFANNTLRRIFPRFDDNVLIRIEEEVNAETVVLYQSETF